MVDGDKDVFRLAALFHDIGKCGQRAESNTARSHAELGSEFISSVLSEYLGEYTGPVSAAIANHHQTESEDDFVKLVAVADRLSMKEVSDETHQCVAMTALLPQLGAQSEGGQWGYIPDTLQPHNQQHGRYPLAIFPQENPQATSRQYENLWQALQRALQQFANGRSYQSIDFITLNALLHNFLSRVPAEGPGGSLDISLYDHLKTTAAIAACLQQELDRNRLNGLYKQEPDEMAKPVCALVKGDISGTQDFLYLLTSSGAARGLRGRSFYLQLLTEAIAFWILRRFDLPIVNLLLAAGGHFYLLVPYQKGTELIGDLRQKIARRLWTAHQGDLSLTIDFAPVSALDFLESENETAFSSKWDEVSRKTNIRKQKKWIDLDVEQMVSGLFTPYQAGRTDSDQCQVCHGEWRSGTDALEGDVRKCRRCSEFEKLGNELRYPSHLLLFEVQEQDPSRNCDWKSTLRAFGFKARIAQDNQRPDAPSDAKSAIVYTFALPDDFPMNMTHFQWEGFPVAYDFRLLAGATPQKINDRGQQVICEFSDLANASEGVKWLGVLRMDVDSLGELFKTGLGTRASISRVATLSEALRLFFEGWVTQLSQQYNRHAQGEKDALYLIYAGGDDLFVVGAWSILPELAKEIRDDFRKFIGGDHITLSGGIAIEHQKFPLYQLAEDAKEALDGKAKELKRNGKEKDAICFLQTALGWEQFEKIRSWQIHLRAMLKPEADVKALPRAFITRMAEIYAIYDTNRRHVIRSRSTQTSEQFHEMIHYHRWQWRLVYQLHRFADRYKHFETTIDEFQGELKKQGGIIDYLHILARWTELLTREEHKDET